MANERPPVSAIVGVGPGNGEALARRFAADGYAVALMARRPELIERLAGELPGARPYVCDAADATSVAATFAKARAELGDVDVLAFNAGSGVWGTIEQVSAEDFERSWRINTLGLFLTAREVIPAMRAGGKGAIVVIGATASRRGVAGTAAFAPAKMAQKGLAESMARHLGPSGNPRRADHRGRHRALALGSGALSRPPCRRLHRPRSRRRHRRLSREAGPLGLEFRGRGAAVRGDVVR